MTEQEILAKVRNIMNEAGEETALTLLTEDTVKLDEYIKSCIPDAINIVIQNSPVMCVNRKNATATVTNNGDGTGYIVLPSDFISLIALKLPQWKRIVVNALSVNSEQYRQQTEYTMAGLNKPMCFLSYNSSGRILQYFAKGTTGTTVDIFSYEAKYNTTDGLNQDANDPIAIAVCYMVASLVYSIFENPNTAKEMQTTSLNLIPKQ